jgi:CRP-like cAMP-binding protein
MITPDHLTQIPLLKNLDVQYIRQICKMARIENFSEGTVLFRQGQMCPSIYFILSGQCVLGVEESGAASEDVSRLGPGELLGWSPMLGQRPMTATARGETSGQIAILDAKSLLEFSESNPPFGMAFLREIAMVISNRLLDARRNFAKVKRHRPPLSASYQDSD